MRKRLADSQRDDRGTGLVGPTLPGRWFYADAEANLVAEALKLGPAEVVEFVARVLSRRRRIVPAAAHCDAITEPAKAEESTSSDDVSAGDRVHRPPCLEVDPDFAASLLVAGGAGPVRSRPARMGA